MALEKINLRKGARLASASLQSPSQGTTFAANLGTLLPRDLLPSGRGPGGPASRARQSLK
eukprot:5945576-Pyramimonas_sp.AAC.1